MLHSVLLGGTTNTLSLVKDFITSQGFLLFLITASHQACGSGLEVLAALFPGVPVLPHVLPKHPLPARWGLNVAGTNSCSVPLSVYKHWWTVVPLQISLQTNSANSNVCWKTKERHASLAEQDHLSAQAQIFEGTFLHHFLSWFPALYLTACLIDHSLSGSMIKKNPIVSREKYVSFSWVKLKVMILQSLEGEGWPLQEGGRRRGYTFIRQRGHIFSSFIS